MQIPPTLTNGNHLITQDLWRRICSHFLGMRAQRRHFPARHIFNLSVDDPGPTGENRRMSRPPDTNLDQIFAALSDPTRRGILTMLLEDDMAVTDVAHPFDMSLAAISKHLKVLAEAGLITQEKRGRVIWCKLMPDAMRAATVWIAGFGLFEALDLDAFERFLQDEISQT